MKLEGYPLGTGGLAFPVGAPRSLRVGATVTLGTNSLRRKVFRLAMRTLSGVGLDGMALRLWDDVPWEREPIRLVWEAVRDRFSFDAVPILQWHDYADRRRVHLYVANEAGEVQAFAKIATDSRNADKIRNEAAMLRRVAACNDQAFTTPKLLDVIETTAATTVLTEWIGGRLRPFFGSGEVLRATCVRKYCGAIRRGGMETIAERDWWVGFRAAFPRLAERAAEGMRGGIKLAELVHGDLGPANVIQVGESLCIVDWEESGLDAPALVDELCFKLGRDFHRVRRRPPLVAEELIDAHRDESSDMILGLAFLWYRKVINELLVREFEKQWIV